MLEVTLSGLLNFVDGLWSTCGEERTIVFTTNYKERLDPALLQPGRMDMHIHMGCRGPHAFRVLASNYNAIDDHPLFPQIDGLVREVTLAEVAEDLMILMLYSKGSYSSKRRKRKLAEPRARKNPSNMSQEWIKRLGCGGQDEKNVFFLSFFFRIGNKEF